MSDTAQPYVPLDPDPIPDPDAEGLIPATPIPTEEGDTDGDR